MSYSACQEERDLCLAEVGFGKCHRLIQQVPLASVNWRSGSCPEILVFLFGKPDWDTWIRSSMDANSSVYLTCSATKKGMKRLFINILALRVFKKAVEFVFRTGGGTTELLEDWHGVGDTNSSSTSKRFAMFWCTPGVMSMRSLISLSQQRSVADTITILL